MRLFLILLFSFTTVISAFSQENLPYWRQLALPDTIGTWIQPSREKPAIPVWGHVNGIQVGLAPQPGPRGLLRIYTPYLGLKPGEVMNFIALEPIPKGSEHRGLSELEMSSLDEGKRGKRFWSSNDSTAVVPLNEDFPARGIVENLNGLVNGRFAYWASDDPIPGGIAFENFEMKEPFQNGATFIFGISPKNSEDIIEK